MNAEDLSTKYISATEKALTTMQPVKGNLTVSEECVNELLNYIQAYLADAKYFSEQKKFETSLTSIAYCEGLIDALKIIGALKAIK